jgi:hypothetical protein
MAKRGVFKLPLYTVVALAISGLIVITLLALVTAVGKSTTLQREFIAKDLALLIDTIHASPGDLEYTYVFPGKFQLTIKDNLVIVKDPIRGLSSAYQFATSKKILMSSVASDVPPKAVKITKKGNTISFSTINDRDEKEAVESFGELQEFAKANAEKNYDFDCKEEYEPKLPEGYFIVISEKGDATLFLEQEKTQVEELTGNVPKLRQLSSSSYELFVVSSNSFQPSTAIGNVYQGKLIMVRKANQWHYSKPDIKVNELKGCEATILEKRLRQTKP